MADSNSKQTKQSFFISTLLLENFAVSRSR